MTAVGLVVNPNAGKDIRRLVADATPSSDRSKISSLRRVAIAAAHAGAERLLIAPDHRGLGTAAVADLDLAAEIRFLDMPLTGTASDTVRSGRELQAAKAAVVVCLGGDGTHRDLTIGWRDAPLVPVSTGTNNAFPHLVDPTLAGTAAGLVAAGKVALCDSATASKLLTVRAADQSTLALVDVALVDARFTGSRAVWDPATIRTIVAALADPASLGLSSVTGRLHQALASDDWGVMARCHPSAESRVSAPIVPGTPSDVGIVDFTALQLGEEVVVAGPGIVALDGEREIVLHGGEAAAVRLERNGPHVIDPWAAVRAGAEAGVFRS